MTDFVTNFTNTLRGLAKIAIQSRCTNIRPSDHSRNLIVMGNGPSLATTIANEMAKLRMADTMAVNFAALAPEFGEIKPRYYILADPLFFGIGKHERVPQLMNAIGNVTWDMTLIVPRQYRKSLPANLLSNTHINIATFNNVGIEGFPLFETFAYSHRMAMPRPRNVLIPAIMCGIWLGYHNIYIVGADHSWMQTISVDSDNNVISVQPHFYKESATEQKRVDTTYRGYRLHDIVYSFYVAFRSYHQIAHFARKAGVSIFNSTPESMIDAFPRRPL